MGGRPDPHLMRRLLALTRPHLRALVMATLAGMLSLGAVLVIFVYVGPPFVAISIALLLLTPLLAALTIALAVPFLLTAVQFNRHMEDIAAASREALGDVTNVVEESAGGIRVLKAFGQEAQSVRRLEEAAGRRKAVNLQMVNVRGFYIPALQLLPNLILALILGV